MALLAIRGATSLDEDREEHLLQRTRELIEEILERNALTHDDVVSVFFTGTPDIVSAFPAVAARELGFGDVPLMCAQEMDVAGAAPLIVRLMMHVDIDRKRADIQHVYQHRARQLRQDLAQ